MIKEYTPTLIKGLIYALCFWTVFKVINAAVAAMSSGDTRTQAAQTEYDRQLQKSAAMLEWSEKNMTRMDALMTRQEENARRLDAVVSQMERTYSK